MARRKQLISDFNQVFRDFYTMSAEVQILACVALWSVMAVLMRLMVLGGGLPSVHEPWLGFVVFLVGLFAGPAVAVVTAMVSSVLLSPVGVFAETAGGGLQWLERVSLLLASGLTGGFLKRLILWLNEELYQAQHEVASTGLPNLKATLDYLEKALESGKLNKQAMDVLNVRLGNLDAIRESVGQEKVDRLLSKFADKLKLTLGEGAFVGQLSGNELFGIQQAGDRATGDVKKLVRDMMDQPIHLDGEDYTLNAASGLHRTSQKHNSSTPQQLLDEAAAAAIAAEKNEQDFQVTAESGDSVTDMGKLVSSRQIQSAMENDEVALLYIPRLSAKSGYFSSLEAVVCWQHPTRGQLWLSDFKAMLQEEPAVQGLSVWAAKLAFRDADQWLEKGYKFRMSLGITINEELGAPVLAYILKELERRAGKDHWLAVEVSEKALLKAETKCVNYLKHLQHRGVSVVVNNYGDGGATIQEIFRMPVDAVKLSVASIEKAMTHSDGKRELGGLIRMIHSRGLTSIAEGVQDKSSLLLLRELGVEELQGALLSKSLPPKDIPWGRIRG